VPAHDTFIADPHPAEPVVKVVHDHVKKKSTVHITVPITHDTHAATSPTPPKQYHVVPGPHPATQPKKPKFKCKHQHIGPILLKILIKMGQPQDKALIILARLHLYEIVND
jgi:hypothetical protein